jgi:hypothetical protein
MPGLLQGQAGSGPKVVDAQMVQQGSPGNPAKAAGAKSSGPDPMLCNSGLFECDWEAGTMRMNILIPDAPVGPAPAAGQTASWWARLKNWLFGSEPAAANGAGKAFVRTEAKNLAEKLALDEAKAGAGRRIMQGKK